MMGVQWRILREYVTAADSARRSVMYNTGDLARWFPNGSLETLGRNDDQVKAKVCSLYL
jgi:non-ribosomal peptide synthetase component F